MIKDDLNSKFRKYVQDNSITDEDRKFFSKIYKSFQDTLGSNNILQIGSYPRLTAIKPLHDLDILYILKEEWSGNKNNPSSLLKEVKNKIKNEYENPTKYKHHVSLQTHSVTIIFKENDKEIFAVDIVPAYIYSSNEFGEDTYKIPEVAKQKYRKRKQFYDELKQKNIDMGWIHTDPKGYIKIAKDINQKNYDFIRVVKFIKSWKNLQKEKREFSLKSFHLEQIITKYYKENYKLEIFDAIFKFFVEMPKIIKTPSIKDRANKNKFIDKYLEDISGNEREIITQARDCFLKKMEQFSENNCIKELIEPCLYKRAVSEEFLFDNNIPILTNNKYKFQMKGYLENRKGFRNYRFDINTNKGVVGKDKCIKFIIENNNANTDYYKWKVKNDDNCKEPRGEITETTAKERTKREHTEYEGKHYVECYAILNGICIAKSRQDVIIL